MPVWDFSDSGPDCHCVYRIDDLSIYDTTGSEVNVQVLVVTADIGVVTSDSMTPQCGTSWVQVLVVRVDISVVPYETKTPQ